MPRILRVLMLVCAAGICSLPAVRGDEPAAREQIERGAYLVRHVAMCVECHTPRDGEGRLLESELLKGAPIPVSRPPWAASWAVKSANIAGLLGYTRMEAERFLQTGIRPDGTRPDLPMPPFRMSPADAQAVVAYLKAMDVVPGPSAVPETVPSEAAGTR